jgi:hypothetical protein
MPVANEDITRECIDDVPSIRPEDRSFYKLQNLDLEALKQVTLHSNDPNECRIALLLINCKMRD